MAVLAVIAGAGSFTHIRDTAAEHGQRGPMAWAVAVCIDLTCVMAARERQRDKRLGIAVRRLSWPAVVLAGGGGSEPGGRPRPGPAERLWAGDGRGPVRGVPRHGVDDRAPRRPPRPRHRPWAGSPVPEAAAPVPGGVPAADGGASRPRPQGRRRPRQRTSRTSRRSRRPAAPRPSTWPGTAGRSAATRCAPAWASPTRPPPTCCASSAATPGPPGGRGPHGRPGRHRVRPRPAPGAPPLQGTGPRPGRDATVRRAPRPPSGPSRRPGGAQRAAGRAPRAEYPSPVGIACSWPRSGLLATSTGGAHDRRR
jgi:hypothetical protein